ncbi:hypothetical protein AAG570_000874 [Ranatra chinensis]|uniref:Cytochrome P450 n=1 Tax=Ranatra chinensis TaxID=642074 RepID=A0ABD0YYZ6_9HEMI
MLIVWTETLRKYPVFSFISRKGRKPFRIPGTDTVIEMGTPVFVPVHAIHHDPRYYPDPERFDPDRFTAEEVAKRPPEAYLPFGIGPRMCLGECSIYCQLHFFLLMCD